MPKKYKKSGTTVKTPRRATQNTQLVETAWGTVEMEMKPKAFTPTLPKVPYKKWVEICSFLKHCQQVHNGEGIVSLTLIKGTWHTICWFQEISGTLHVKYDHTTEENQALLTPELKEALENIHCTVHSHNTSSAFQSGDDKDDELQKIGWHITMGTLNKNVMDSHGRWNLNQPAKRDEEGNKIRNSVQAWIPFSPESIISPMNLPKALEGQPGLRFSHKDTVHATPQDGLFPEEWKDRAKKAPQIRYTGTAVNPMIPFNSGTSTILKRDEGSDYNVAEISQLSDDELKVWARAVIKDNAALSRQWHKVHAEVQKITVSKMGAKSLQNVVQARIKSWLPYDIAEDDANVVSAFLTKIAMDYGKSFAYSHTKFDQHLKKEIEMSETAFFEYMTSGAQDSYSDNEITKLRDELKQMLGPNEVDKLSDREVLLYYQP